MAALCSTWHHTPGRESPKAMRPPGWRTQLGVLSHSGPGVAAGAGGLWGLATAFQQEVHMRVQASASACVLTEARAGASDVQMAPDLTERLAALRGGDPTTQGSPAIPESPGPPGAPVL